MAVRAVSPFAACRNKRGGGQTTLKDFAEAKHPLNPASGWRTGWSAGLSRVGTGGYAWSSAPGSATIVDGSYLIFNTSDVYPEGNGSRSFGLPVRCVQE